jgi:hypothetical protein
MIDPGLTYPVCTMKTARVAYHRRDATGPETLGLGVNRAQLSRGFHHAGSETDRVGGHLRPSPHTTVRTVPYTAVHEAGCRRRYSFRNETSPSLVK